MRIVHLSLRLLPLVGAALARVVELPTLDDVGLPAEEKDKVLPWKNAPDLEELNMNFFERIDKGYWYVTTYSSTSYIHHHSPNLASKSSCPQSTLLINTGL